MEGFRRSLTASQRATIAVEAKASIEAEIKEDLRARQSEGGKTAGKYRPQDESQVFTKIGKDLKTEPARNAQAEAAKLTGASKGYVADAEKIKAASPETFAKVQSGESTIAEAKKELGIFKPVATGTTKLNGVVVPDPPDIAAKRAATSCR